MLRNLLKDVYEFLYESFSPVRVVSNSILWLISKVTPKFRKRINERIDVEVDKPLQFYESGSVPYGGIILNVYNDNHSSLTIEALQVNLSLSHDDSIFQTFSWDKDTISKPPANFQISEVPGKDNSGLEFTCMLPYFLYFPNSDANIYINGIIKFNSTAGPIEHEFEARTRLKQDPLLNMTTVQGDLVRNFSLPEWAIEENNSE